MESSVLMCVERVVKLLQSMSEEVIAWPHLYFLLQVGKLGCVSLQASSAMIALDRCNHPGCSRYCT